MQATAIIQSKQKTGTVHSYVSTNKTPFFGPKVQPKLKVNNPGDVYEQEADAVAEKVMRMPAAETAMPFFQPKSIPVTPLQRTCAACEAEEKLQRQEEEEEEDEVLQTKPVDKFAINENAKNARKRAKSKCMGNNRQKEERLYLL